MLLSPSFGWEDCYSDDQVPHFTKYPQEGRFDSSAVLEGDAGRWDEEEGKGGSLWLRGGVKWLV